VPLDAKADIEPAQGVNPWRVVVLLSIAFAINYVDRQFLFSAFPRIAADLSLSNVQLGLAGSIFTWTYALSMPFSGWFADRWSRTTIIVVAIALWSVTCLATALSTSAGQLLASRMAMGLMESLYVPSAIRLIAECHPGQTRSRALSVHGFAQFAGITLGGFYGGWSAEHIGWRWGYATLTIVGVLYALALRPLLPRHQANPTEGHSGLRIPAHFLRSPLYLVLSAAFFVFCAMLWILYAWTATYIHERYRLGLEAGGFAATFFLQAGAAAGVLMGGWLGDRAAASSHSGRFTVAAFGLLACAPFAFLVFTVHQLMWLEVASLIFGLCSGLFVANVFSSLYDVVDRDSFSFATGLLNLTGGLGAGAAILLAGALKDQHGMPGLMLWCSTFAAIAAPSLFLTARITLILRQAFRE
jgi:MFS family permease